MGRRVKEKLASENGYLLVSTLFFLIFSGLFSHSVLQLSSNHLIQLNQLSSAYQGKAALEMSTSLLKAEINESRLPVKGHIETSMGTVDINGKEVGEAYHYSLVLVDIHGTTYTKEFYVDMPENAGEEDKEIKKE